MFRVIFPLVFLVLTGLQAEEGFPLRKKYPQVKVITTEDLLKTYANTIIIDVRAVVEYNVCYINGATNIPVVLGGFAEKLEKIRAKDGTKNLIFYCNGHTCSKSYKGWIAADKAGFKNILCYDGGIFDWIAVAADKATLLNKSPANPKDVISKEEFLQSCLEKDAFDAAVAKQQAVVIDIREPMQRKEYSGIEKSRNIPFDRLVDLLKKGKMKDKPIFAYDSVGKQVRWLEYHLRRYGYKDYKFLKGGARALMPKKEE